MLVFFVDFDKSTVPSVLTSNILSPFYVQRGLIDEFLNTGAIVSKLVDITFNSGYSFSPFSSNVKKSAIRLFEGVLEDLISGEINPFCGELVQESFGVNCVNQTFLQSNFLNNIEFV